MTIKRVTEKPTVLKIKTGLRAGEHCRDAFRGFIHDPNNYTAQNFVNCCQDDDKCLR
jgi:hypothetical protein